MALLPPNDHTLNVYLAALHFAAMTLTSIGYGDVLPHSSEEYLVSILCQLEGALIWTTGIATITAVLANADPGAIRFQSTMDELNHMMKVRKLPADLKTSARLFFLQAKKSHEHQAHTDLLNLMSPSLRRNVARLTSGKHVRMVWYLRDVSDDFVACVCTRLTNSVFMANEMIESDGSLCILLRGFGLQRSVMKHENSIWGEDFILSDKLRRVTITLTLSFSEVILCDSRCFMDVLTCASPADYAKIRKYIVRLIVIRGIILTARERVKTTARSQLKQFMTSADAADIRTHRKQFKSEPVKSSGARHGELGRGCYIPGLCATPDQNLSDRIESLQNEHHAVQSTLKSLEQKVDNLANLEKKIDHALELMLKIPIRSNPELSAEAADIHKTDDIACKFDTISPSCQVAVGQRCSRGGRVVQA